MFGIILTSRRSPARCRRPDVERIILFPRTDTTGPEDLEGPAAASPRVRQTAGAPSPGLRIFEPKSRGSTKANIGRARRLLAADVNQLSRCARRSDDTEAPSSRLGASVDQTDARKTWLLNPRQ
jgi:hypothetical protein